MHFRKQLIEDEQRRKEELRNNWLFANFLDRLDKKFNFLIVILIILFAMIKLKLQLTSGCGCDL